MRASKQTGYSREGAMPVLIQIAAEVLAVSAIPLAMAAIILIAFELVLIG
jgi:hypothetical protein